jgi:hypothetical protein
MKTANRFIILVSCALAGSLFISLEAHAQTGSPVMPPATPHAPSTAGAHSTAMPSPAAPTTAALPKATSPAARSASPGPEIKIPDLSKPLPGGKKDTKEAKSDELGGKIPDSVKDVIKHLSTKTEDVTLDDLNAAREAIAKLDALIDIEKRLADLEKIRSDREKENDKKLIDALPKAALTPPPQYIPPVMERPMPVVQAKPATPIASPPPPKPVEITVIRIEGSNNRYGALIKDGDNTRMVHVGDHLSDGTVVTSVSARGVQLEKDKASRVAEVKDVHGVFGDSP